MVEGIEWRSQTDAVKKAIEEQNIVEKWQGTKEYQRAEKIKTRKAMGDFDRYPIAYFVSFYGRLNSLI